MIKPDSTQELTIDDWLDALEGVRPKRNGGHMALCPTHDDNNPSLSLDVGDDGTVLVKCFAGCEYESIKAAAGLNGHARPNRGGAHRKSKKPPKTYTTQAVYSQPVFEFKLPSGEVAYVQRHKGPYFRPIGGGKWVDQLGDVERIPYNLPGLLDGVRAGETVYHVEGCKDVDTATGWGLTATTTGGTNTWRSEYRPYYADADVVIVPDNDPPGFVYAETVAGDLAGVARSVKVVQLPDLPEGGDLTDFKEAGGIKEDLLAIVEAAPQWTASDETLEEDALARTGGKPNQMDLVRRYRGREPDVAYGVGS